MFFFRKKYSLSEAGFFKGYTDYHSHILPGVDDGCQKTENSLKVLEYFESLGIKKVFLTPHVMRDFPNSEDHLREVFSDFRKEYKGGIELELAAEYMADSDFSKHIDNGLLTLPGDRALIESSYLAPINNFDDQLYDAATHGYIPVIAHAERYTYMTEREYREFLNKGYEMQLNILSLTNYYGHGFEERALKMLHSVFYTYLGTDIHRKHSFEDFEKKIKLSSKDIDLLYKLNNRE